MDNTMYLSRFLIPKQQMLKRRVFSEYDLHKLIWTCFPDRPDEKRSFLFRTEELSSGIQILLLSREQPVPIPFAAWDGTKSFSASFAAGSLFMFRLKANPVQRGSADRKLHAITNEAALSDWLHRKADRHGFSLKSVPEFSACHLAAFSKKQNQAQIALNIVDISGVLSVTDADAFAAAVRNGIGRGRAFGCGMLLLRRIEL